VGSPTEGRDRAFDRVFMGSVLFAWRVLAPGWFEDFTLNEPA